MKKKKDQIHDKLNTTTAQLVSKNIIKTKSGAMMKRGGGAAYTYNPAYYNFNQGRPEVMFGPKTSQEQHRVWRTLYQFDPIAGTCIDLFSELPWSDFIISNVDDPRIKEIFEIQKDRSNLLDVLPDITREYLTLGKAVIHNTFDGNNYLWKDIVLQNPDYIEVVNMPIFSREPFLSLIPDPQLKMFINSKDPRIKEMFRGLPSDVLRKLLVNKKIPLSNANTTYLYRKISGYDYQGTSLMTRLYKIVMYEDAIYNASIAVAQRNAAPLRLFKLGDANSGWIPSPEQTQQFIDMLMQAESDPYSVLVYHYGVEVDYVGVSDRLMGISREWDFVSQVKFMALGMSRELVSGESTYSSMQGSLQVMTERLRTLRQKIENAYIIEKFFKPIARVHKFYKRSAAEIKHNVRIQKNINDQDRDLILPTIKWNKVLEGTKDTSLLSIWRELQTMGALSVRTYAAGAGIDLDEERKNIKEDNEWLKKHQAEMTPPLPPGGGDQGFNLGGSLKDKKAFNKKENILRNLSQIKRLKKSAGGNSVPSEVFDTKIWDKNGTYNNINFQDVEEIARIALEKNLDWDQVESELIKEGLSDSKIATTRDIFEQEGIVEREYAKNKKYEQASVNNLNKVVDNHDNDGPSRLGTLFLSGK